MSNTWDERFSVGIKALDDDHKIVFDMLGSLLASQSGPDEAKFVHKTLNDLSGHLDHHFKSEEELMNLYRYPDVKSHQKKHSAFIVKLSTYLAMVDFGSLPPSQDVANLLIELQKNHILTHDKELGSFLLQHGHF